MALSLLTAGCGDREQEPVDLPSLRTKLQALTADPCHSDPPSQPPYGCEKYVTQLANAARTVTAAGRDTDTDLRKPGTRMAEGVRDFNKRGCDNKRPPSEEACYTALATIADAVTDALAELEE